MGLTSAIFTGKRMIKISSALMGALVILVLSEPNSLFAHVSVTSGAVVESTDDQTSRVLVRFGIPHGCRPEEEAPSQDTYKLRLIMPEALADVSIRAVVGDFGGTATLIKEADSVKEIIWERGLEEVQPSDDYYYSVAIRFSVPKDMAFKTLYFPAYQHCIVADAESTDVDIVSAWVREGSHGHNHGGGDDGGEDDEDVVDDTPRITRVDVAPRLSILPQHQSGWNQWYSGENHIHGADALRSIFRDAQIVWVEEKAFSANPVTMELIEEDPDVAVLEEIHDGAEIWVKY